MKSSKTNLVYIISLITFTNWSTLAVVTDTVEKDEFIYGTFPTNFQWGVGTSSYQIEGAWDADGKGKNIWDDFTHENKGSIKDSSNGNTACDSYHHYEKDVQLLKNIGVQFYRFSISWARLLPEGTTASINQPGIDYYNKLIDALILNNITPVITIHHWDLPSELQSNGGWLNEEIIEHFGNFARLLYDKFGDRVKKWITFNEAWVICVIGYGSGEFAPGIKEMAQSPYLCVHNILKAHATAYRIYEKEFKDDQRGEVGITIDSGWLEPADPSNPEDIEAAQRALHFKFGLFANPIIYGKYPDIVRKLVDGRSKQEGRSTSRLPTFDKFWTNKIKGSFDIIGLNHYSTYLVTSAKRDSGPGWDGDQNIETFQDDSWPKSGSSWLRTVPWGFRKVLNWIKETYNNPPLVVTENGYSDLPDVQLNDQGRIQYYQGYINNLLKAVLIDGCNVQAYSCWSLMDNFEWTSGYTERFGLHWVNFTDPGRERIPKESVKHLRRIFLSNGFPYPKLPWEARNNLDNECERKEPQLRERPSHSSQADLPTSCGCGG